MNEQDISTILQQYDIGPLHTAIPFDTPQRPWKISAKAGDFVVRECVLNSRLEDLDFEHRLTSWLDTRGFCVSLPVRTRDGRTWCERDGRLIAIYSLVSGEHFQIGNTAQAYSAGKALARFHKAAHAFPNARNRRLPEGYLLETDNIAYLMRQHGDRVEIASLVAEFDKLNSEFPSYLPRTLVFNDFHPGNMLFEEDKFSGAFDLDCCFWGTTIVDVALSLLEFAFSFEGEQGSPETVTFNLQCGQALLAGYKECGTLTREEIHFLPLAMRRRVRTCALRDLADVARQSKRWVKHEWDFTKLQMDLVDANSVHVIKEDTHGMQSILAPCATKLNQ